MTIDEVLFSALATSHESARAQLEAPPRPPPRAPRLSSTVSTLWRGTQRRPHPSHPRPPCVHTPVRTLRATCSGGMQAGTQSMAARRHEAEVPHFAIRRRRLRRMPFDTPRHGRRPLNGLDAHAHRRLAHRHALSVPCAIPPTVTTPSTQRRRSQAVARIDSHLNTPAAQHRTTPHQPPRLVYRRLAPCARHRTAAAAIAAAAARNRRAVVPPPSQSCGNHPSGRRTRRRPCRRSRPRPHARHRAAAPAAKVVTGRRSMHSEISSWARLHSEARRRRRHRSPSERVEDELNEAEGEGEGESERMRARQGRGDTVGAGAVVVSSRGCRVGAGADGGWGSVGGGGRGGEVMVRRGSQRGRAPPRRNVIADFCRASTAAARGAAYHVGQSWPLWAVLCATWTTTAAIRREPARAMVLFVAGYAGRKTRRVQGARGKGWGLCNDGRSSATQATRRGQGRARRRDERRGEGRGESRGEGRGEGSEVRVAR